MLHLSLSTSAALICIVIGVLMVIIGLVGERVSDRWK